MCEAVDIDRTVKDLLQAEELLKAADVEMEYKSSDKHRANNLGNHMLEFCTVNKVFICNGRVAKD